MEQRKKGSKNRVLRIKNIFIDPWGKVEVDKFQFVVNKTFISLLNDYNYFKKLETALQLTNKQSKEKWIQDFTTTGKGIKSLQGLEWLNDEVINGYFQLVSDRCDLKTFMNVGWVQVY